MKAIRINKVGDSSVLEYEEIVEKDLAGNEVRIKVTATAVNYIDTLIRSGQMPPGYMPELPFIPGVECIGVVEQIAANVKDLKVGDKVAYFGEIGASTYAEYVTAQEHQLIKILNAVDDLEAAVVPVNYSTAYHMLNNIARVSKNLGSIYSEISSGKATLCR